MMWLYSAKEMPVEDEGEVVAGCQVRSKHDDDQQFVAPLVRPSPFALAPTSHHTASLFAPSSRKMKRIRDTYHDCDLGL
jgi:hypothetical protein